MPYEDDETRREARARLQARLDRRAASESSPRSETPTRQSGRYSRSGSYVDRFSEPNLDDYSSRTSRTSRSSRSSSSYDDRAYESRDRYSSGTHSRQRSQTARSGSSNRSGSSRGSHTSTAYSPSLLDRLPFSLPPIALIIAAVVIVLLLIFIVTNIVRCAAPSEPEGQPVASEQAASTSSSSSSAASSDSSSSSSASAESSSSSASSSTENQEQTSDEEAEIDENNDAQKELVTLLGEDETTKLLTQAQKDKQALWIAAHPDRYAFDGIDVQYKVLKLAADEPAAIPFVREFPSQYPSKDVKNDESIAMDTGSPSEIVPDTKVPHLYQWDRRWGNTVYSSTAFGLTGCGPTSLAMAYQGVKNTTDKNPHDFAVLAEERGYMSEYQGTGGEFFTDTAGELGMNCEMLYPTSEVITDALSSGKVIIANLGPGLFTEHGHFFVLAGLADDGKVIINDPYSVVRSSQTWDADTIANESIALYAFSAA